MMAAEVKSTPAMCTLCLSTDRHTYSVDNASWAYKVVAEREPCGARVCWECRATLARVATFKLQAERALRLLDATPIIAAEFTCLSKLSNSPVLYTNCSVIDSDCKDIITSENQIKSEDDFEDLQECNAWVDTPFIPQDVKPDTDVSNDTSNTGTVTLIPANDTRNAGTATHIPANDTTNMGTARHIPANDTRNAGTATHIPANDTRNMGTATHIPTNDTRKMGTATHIPANHTGIKCEEKTHNSIKECSSSVSHSKFKYESKNKRAKKKIKDKKIDENTKGQEKKRKTYTYSKSESELMKNLMATSKVEFFTGSTQDVLKARRILLALLTGRFRCLLCIEKYKTKADLDRHTEIMHFESAGEHTCDICSCRFSRTSALSSHRAAHHRLYRCLYPQCDFICSLPARVVTHVRRHQQTDRPSVRQNTKCNICGGEFRSRAYYLQHRNIHLSQQRFECDLCSKTYKTRPQIARHLKNHRLKYMCETCGKRCPSNSALKAHSLAHMDYALRDFECGECNKKFINKHKLLSHLKYHSGERPYKCTDCHKEYTDVYQLNFHRKHHHNKSDSAKKTWKRTTSLHRNKPIRTPLAPAPRDAARVESHECHICGKKFSDKVCLRTHFSVHSDARPYKCDECEKSFKVYAALYTHKYLHKGVKPHQCSVCGAQFALKGNLTVHSRTHSDEKPYECNICKRKFKFPSNLTKHVKIHDVVVK